jgi:uncharacterized protein YbjT (DUF2867 family)
MITIAGGTGLVGKQLTQTLLQTGAHVRVLTRDTQKAKSTFDKRSVEIVGIDFDEPQTLRDAFKGSDQAFLSTGTSDRQVRDELALIDAAVSAGVLHLVNLSVGGAGRGIQNNVLEWHSEIDAHIKTKHVISTLVRPATYAETIFHVAAGFVPSGQWGGVAGSGRVCLIDTRDVAAASAAILLGGAKRYGNRVYDLTGPGCVTMQDIARLLSEGLGKSVEYLNRSAAEQRAVYRSVGLPSLTIEVLLGLDDLTREGVFAVPTPTVLALTGETPRSVADWIEEHIASFTLAIAA